VENEHIGNADQYRVTREVPLPYAFHNVEAKDDSDNDDYQHAQQGGITPQDSEAPRLQSRESFVEIVNNRQRSARLTPMTSEGEVVSE